MYNFHYIDEKPWIERFEYYQKFKNLNLSVDRFPKLLEYISRMKELPVIRETINSAEAYAKFFEGFFSGPDADYDF